MIFTLMMILCLSAVPSFTHGNEKASPSEFLAYAGKSYAGFEDPEFIKYDAALRSYEAQRIKKKFGLALDPKTYSGFDLLEIESLLKFKKSGEALDTFLGKFPKRTR
jgi:hypothetical protein